ncbi:MAG: acetylxylan esterase [Kiritimatiellae bacterium]|nr:acetylxylan esterase [Kiritimatiellia bacterium]
MKKLSGLLLLAAAVGFGGCVPAPGRASCAPNPGECVTIDPAEKSEFNTSKMRFSGATDKSPVAYKVGETMRFTFSLACNQPVPSNKVFYVKWSRRGDDGVNFSGFDRITEDRPVVVETSIDRPGFVNVNASLTDVQGNWFCYFQDDYNRIPLQWEGSAGADVDAILPCYDEPADFDAFWAKQLAALAAVPVKAELVDVPTNKLPAKFRGGTHVAQAFSVACAGPNPVTGFLVYPRDAQPKSLPVRITFDGYGPGCQGAGPAEWLFSPWPKPMVKISVNAHGYKLLQPESHYKKLKLDGYAFNAHENEKPETSYFLGEALRLVRAYDFAKTLPVWNGKDLIATGGSQGGFQSVLAASLVKGLTETHPDVTWMCDCAGPTRGRLPGWRPDYRPGLAYFDSVFHARRIPATCRLDMGRVGLGDYVCPPTGVAACYNAANCPKSVRWWQNSTHLWATPTSIRRCWTNEAPAGAGVKGTARIARTARAVTGVPAAFDPKAWTIASAGRPARAFDFSRRCNLRKAGGNLKTLSEATIRGTLVAEADGEVVLGAGLDWWWECSVNGEGVFGRTRVNGSNGSGAFEASDWTFAAPVKKGANEVAFKVVLGEQGFGEVAVLSGAREVDPAAAAAYRAATAAYRAPSSVPFEPVWASPTCVLFDTAQPHPAGIEYRKRGEKQWRQAWDVRTGVTRHAVTLPDPSLWGDFEYRKVEWAREEDMSIVRDEKDVRSTKLDLSKADFDAVTDKNPLAYGVGETMRFRYTFRLNQPDPAGRRFFLRWERFGDDGVFDAGVEPLRDGETVEVSTKIDHPGFVRVDASVVDAKGRTMTYWQNDMVEQLRYLSAACAAAETLQPACEEPADFVDFWAKQKAELKAVPVKCEMTELSTNQIPARFRATHRAWAVRVDCSGPRPVTGYLAMPRGARAKSLPACCGFNGYGCGADALPGEWHYERAKDSIYFHINAHGYDLMKDKKYYDDFAKKINAKGGYGLVDEENEKPETAYFRYMAHRVVRAFDFVKTLPEWNGKDLKARGGSQGGLQTTWAGALVEGLTECEPWVTWCTDINGGAVGRYVGWRPAYRPGLAYYDTVIHTRHIPKTCKLVISRAGLGDKCCPPSGLACQYNAASCPKSINWVQSSDHGTIPKANVRHDYAFSAPAGAGVTGTAKKPAKLRKGNFVKAKLAGIAPSGQYRRGKGKDGKDLPVKTTVTLEGTLEAEADGEAILGAGFDWWWTCKVNGADVFGVPTVNPGGNGGSCSPADWTFTAPVKKGANKIAFEVVLGEQGFGGAVARDPADFPDGVDAAPAEHYRSLVSRFPRTWDFGDGAKFVFDGNWK